MNKLTIQWLRFFVALIFPFITVWVAFILTGGAFSTTAVFQDTIFWGLAGSYWFLTICLVGFFFQD